MSGQHDLRAAARRVDQACAALRQSSAPEGDELWRAVASGDWTLVDHFEHHGRRYIVARRNHATSPGGRPLTEREITVAQRAARGQANKVIAIDLGISTSSVATHLRRAARKLGVSTRVDLIALVQKLSLPR